MPSAEATAETRSHRLAYISSTAGISTINEKLERICPQYYAINELMGGQAFINPWFKVDAQADNETETLSPSEPAGNEIRSSDMESNDDCIFISTIS
ncbi:hypothetical protein VP01_10205g1 [Puccinia sorghi]|uniref:Uncharacterized protein n=1 Tax=Puccinia sorghi TaxID=27349 RepID=A0A0L6VV59_9BASI|nr:hypothetical protein VP01_10205g1 [Puccinia sorghi]